MVVFREQHPVLFGTTLLAYGFGLRHAVEACAYPTYEGTSPETSLPQAGAEGIVGHLRVDQRLDGERLATGKERSRQQAGRTVPAGRGSPEQPETTPPAVPAISATAPLRQRWK